MEKRNREKYLFCPLNIMNFIIPNYKNTRYLPFLCDPNKIVFNIIVYFLCLHIVHLICRRKRNK